MATLTVRAATKRDRIRLRVVRQREANLLAPWERPDNIHQGATDGGATIGLAEALLSSDVYVADVDGELCGFAIYDRGDRLFRWNVRHLGAGSPRVDATDDVAIELWVALLEEGIRMAGRAGARRLFAFSTDDSAEYVALRNVGFVPYARYDVLRGSFKRGLRESIAVRPQHESDLWSIHQLYNRVTPRAVQFAEALTSDAWVTEPGSRLPFRRTGRIGFVVPTEDGIGVAFHIDFNSACPVVRVLCDDQLTFALRSIIADCLDHLSYEGPVDIILPEYQLDRSNLLIDAGFSRHATATGLVRHTTASAALKGLETEVVRLRQARAAVSVPYQAV